MNKKYSGLVYGIPLIIGMYFFSQWYIDINRNASEDIRYLTYAIVSGILALSLHFFKDIRSVKNNESILKIVDSLELLLLIMTPILSIFQVHMKNYPDAMLVLLGVGIFAWWMTIVIRTNNDSGKVAFTLSAQLYAGLMAIVAIAAWLIALFS